MPVYEYTCENCGRTFDLFVRSATRRSEPRCPDCESTNVKKAVSLFGIAGGGGRSEASASCGPGPI